jgi:mannobiose 2-epimerase
VEKNKLLKDQALNDLRIAKEEMMSEIIRILDFWGEEVFDQSRGTFIGQIDHNGNKNYKASLGCVMITRMLWAFSAGYQFTKKKKYKAVATITFEFIIKYFWDQENGGLFWEVDPNGAPVNTKKQAYAQAFGIYGLSEFYKATGDQRSLTYANELFTILETHFLDKDEEGYIEALDKDWKPVQDLRLSEVDFNFPKSMNSHLHILEAYTNLNKVLPSSRLNDRLKSLIDIFLKKILDPETGHFNLFFDMKWNSKIDLDSYGHDIEGAWLLYEAVLEVKNKALFERVTNSSLRMIEATVKDALDQDGSLYYEKKGAELNKEKHWWAQAEAMVGFMHAYELDSDEKHLFRVLDLWKFIKNYLIDLENGEWFAKVDDNNQVITSEDKTGFWKCCYHNSRAMMEVIRRIENQNLK